MEHLKRDLQELLDALTTLSKFSIPIPKKLTSDIRAFREEIQRRKTA